MYEPKKRNPLQNFFKNPDFFNKRFRQRQFGTKKMAKHSKESGHLDV